MPRIKAVTDANGTKFYPTTITKAIYDIDNSQKLDKTISDIQNGKADKATTLAGYGITDALPSSTKYAGSSSAGGAATSAAKLTNTTKVGDTDQPVYFTANGVPAAISYTIGKSVPSDAVFTDTTYSEATTSAAGLMSAADKTKLDGISTTPSGVTGVKGGSEESYRTGNVNITAANIGLGNVGNFKAVSTVASQNLTSTEQANARANIGAGTSSFSGSYNDLSNKPNIPSAANNGTYSVKTTVGETTTTVSDFTADQSAVDDVTFVQGANVTITPNATNRTITIAATNTTYESKAAAASGTELSLVTTGEKAAWNAKTSNTGTVTKVSTGAGLTGGDVTTTGTIKANLTSETKLTNAASDGTETSGRVYPVRLDKNGKLAVNVPWSDTDTDTNTATLKVSDTDNKKISTQETSGSYIQFTGGTNKITIGDGTNSFDVAVTPSITNNVTGSGLTANAVVLGNGSSAVKTSSKTITATLGSDDTTIPTSKAVQTAITTATAGLTGAMHFIGTSSTAITDGGTEAPTISGYSGTAKTSGNVVLYDSSEFVWTGSAWEKLGPEGSYALNSVKVEGTGVLGGGGTLTENRTITHNTSGVHSQSTAQSYGPTADVNGANGNTIKVPQISVDKYGHITSVTERTYTSVNSTYTVNNGTFSVKTKVGNNAAVTAADFTANQSGTDDVTFIQGTNVTLTTDTANRTITVAATDTTYSAATTSAAGLMSAADKTKLDGIATGATANTGTITKVGNTSSGAVTVSSNNNTASFGNAVTVGSVGGVDLKFTMPGNPNTNTWRPIQVGGTDKLTDSSTKINFAGSGATSVSYSSGTITISSTDNNTVTSINGKTGAIAAADIAAVLTAAGHKLTDTDTNTHYTAVPVAGGQTATSNATSATTDPYINIIENSAKSGGIQIKGSGATSVSAVNGVITISSTDTNTQAVSSVVGQTGAVTAAQIGTALTNAGYKLTDTNTTYNFSGTAFTSNNSTGQDANNVTYNAHTYYTSNGPATSLGASTNDGALYSQAYSTSWVGQIAQDYRNGGLYVRCKKDGKWQSWYKVWDSRNLTNLNQLSNGPGYITGITKDMVTTALGYTPPTSDTNTVTSINGKTGAIAAADIATVLTGAGYKLTDTDTNTWKAATTSQEGYVPTLALSGTSSGAKKDTINTQASDYVLTYTSGTETAPVWRKLPANAYANSTYTVNNGTFTVKGAGTAVSSTSANASGNTAVDFVAGSNVTITPDATNGKITIASTDTNTWRPVGTGATDAAAGNHTHTASLASDTGTSAITLAHGGKYKLTAGGQSVIFTMPSDNNTTYSAGTGLSLSSNTFSLATSGVTAGTYKRVTVDSYGRVTAGDQTDADSDTKNTTGTTNKTGTKMYLAAATEQSANPVTYSNSNCYIGTDNCLYSGGTKVLTAHQDISGKQGTVAKLGSTTQPIYTSAAGTFATCYTYAGGTAVTLNGSSKAASTASFYAPTSAGTSGQILTSSGSGAPTWGTAPAAATIKYTTIDSNVTDINANAATQIATLNANALLKTAQSLSSAEKTQVLTNLGITTSQIRNVTVSTSTPTSSDGSNGDIWLIYEP